MCVCVCVCEDIMKLDLEGVSRFYGTVEWNSGMVEWWNGGMECNDQLFMSRGTMLLYYEPASMVVAIR